MSRGQSGVCFEEARPHATVRAKRPVYLGTLAADDDVLVASVAADVLGEAAVALLQHVADGVAGLNRQIIFGV